jgi:hypothetical protein
MPTLKSRFPELDTRASAEVSQTNFSLAGLLAYIFHPYPARDRGVRTNPSAIVAGRPNSALAGAAILCVAGSREDVAPRHYIHRRANNLAAAGARHGVA